MSLQVPDGIIFGLLGPNGAGKTTLLRIINQILEADSGQVYFNGEPLAPHHTQAIGYLPEERGLYKKMKVGEQLLYLGQLKGLSREAVRQKLTYWNERFGMQGWWGKKISDLSKGMQQKVQFVSTVLHEPPLIILDEPFSGFDPVNADLIQKEILRFRDKGHTILFSTHRMESVEELCQELVLLHNSKVILSGTKADIKEQFRSHTFLLETRQPVALDSSRFEVQQHQPTDHRTTLTQVRLQEGTTSEALLQSLIGTHEILRFEEKMPRIHEIFVELVSDPVPEAT